MYADEQIKGLWSSFFQFFASDSFHSYPNIVRRQIKSISQYFSNASQSLVAMF